MFVWAAIFIVVGFLFGRGNTILIKAKETALKNELKNLRLAVSLYNILYKRYPASLEILIDRAYEIDTRRGPALKGVFLKRLKHNREKKLKDPFDNIYLYNPETGVVKSQTERYQDW